MTAVIKPGTAAAIPQSGSNAPTAVFGPQGPNPLGKDSYDEEHPAKDRPKADFDRPVHPDGVVPMVLSGYSAQESA